MALLSLNVSVTPVISPLLSSAINKAQQNIMTSSRLAQISSHLGVGQTGAGGASHSEIPTKIGVKSPDDVVIVDAVRTAMTRGKKGGFKDTVP